MSKYSGMRLDFIKSTRRGYRFEWARLRRKSYRNRHTEFCTEGFLCTLHHVWKLSSVHSTRGKGFVSFTLILIVVDCMRWRRAGSLRSGLNKTVPTVKYSIKTQLKSHTKMIWTSPNKWHENYQMVRLRFLCNYTLVLLLHFMKKTNTFGSFDFRTFVSLLLVITS